MTVGGFSGHFEIHFRLLFLLAQDVEAVLPEAVVSSDDGDKSVDYSCLTPVLIEALKEQQKQINELKTQVERLSRPSAAAVDAQEMPH